MIYARQWKEKITQTKKDVNGLKKELKRAQKNCKNTGRQKKSQIAKLQQELEEEVQHLRQPLLDLQAARDAKMLVFKRETEKLLKLEKPVLEGLDGVIKLGETVNAKFAALGTLDQQLKNPALFYVPFYTTCYEVGLNRRFIFLPPSMANTEGFTAKLKGALGMSKIKQLLVPRFEAISDLIGNVQALAKQDTFIDSRIRDIGEKSNLLDNHLTRGKISEGLLRLRADGWLSDKEYQVVSDGLA